MPCRIAVRLDLADGVRKILPMTRHRSKTGTTDPTCSDALSYTNRKGATYYLHQGTTKTGKPRYFVSTTIREGDMAKMSAGYEFSESINAVVSVRRVGSGGPTVPDTDLAIVRRELGRHAHLGRHRVDSAKGAIVVFEPVGGAPFDADDDLARLFGMPADVVRARTAGLEQRVQYDPVMKFVPEDEPGRYAVYRMTYLGHGGWSWPLDEGRLPRLARKYVKHVGTDALFELM